MKENTKSTFCLKWTGCENNSEGKLDALVSMLELLQISSTKLHSIVLNMLQWFVVTARDWAKMKIDKTIEELYALFSL